MGYTEEQVDILVRAAQVCGCVSLAASLLVLASWWRFKSIRNTSFHLVAAMCVADVGADITYIMGGPDGGTPLCQAQGIAMQFFQLATMLWSSMIAYTLYRISVTEKVMGSGADGRAMLVRYHVCVWGVALLFTLLPLSTGAYGSTGTWDIPWRYAAFYSILWLIILYDLWAYAVVRRRVSAMTKHVGTEGASHGSVQRRSKRVNRFLRTLYYYPAILIFCWAVASANRLYQAVTGDVIFWVSLTQTITVRVMGLLNALVYSGTDSIRTAWHDAGCLCCCPAAAHDLDFSSVRHSFTASVRSSISIARRPSVSMSMSPSRSHDGSAMHSEWGTDDGAGGTVRPALEGGVGSSTRSYASVISAGEAAFGASLCSPSGAEPAAPFDDTSIV